MIATYRIDVVRGHTIDLRLNYFNTEFGADFVMVYDDGTGGEAVTAHC